MGNVIECGQGTSGSWTTPYLREGPHKFWLIASDDHGNQAEPVSVEWTVGKYVASEPCICKSWDTYCSLHFAL